MRTSILLGVCLLTACAAGPRLRYTHPVPADLRDGAIVVALPGSKVTLAPRAFGAAAGLALTPEQAAAGIAAAGEDVVRNVDDFAGVHAIVSAAECATCLVSIAPRAGTTLSVRFRQNTRLVEAVGVDVRDSRLRAVRAVGAVLGAAAPRRAEADSPLRLPAVLDFSEPQSLGRSTWAAIPGNPGWRYRIREVASEAGAVGLATFASGGRPSRVFPVAACADARLEIARDDGEAVASFALRLADPGRVRRMPLPARGTLAMHTVCGADLVTERDDAASPYEVIEAAANEASALRRQADR